MKRLFVILAALFALAACSSFAKTVDDVNDPKDDVALKRCREVGRSAREAGAPAPDAYGAYFDCTREAGLQ